MISEERLTQALTYIASTDEEAADAKADVERAHYKRKKIISAVIEHGEGAMELRKAVAENSKEAEYATMDYLNALQVSERLQNKRKTEMLIVDVFRTLEASRRRGNI